MSYKSSRFRIVGQEYRGFKVTRVVEIDELQCSLIELTHITSQAKVMSILNDDKENLFSLSFQTIPSTSNGVAHILEHTVLCGSKKFPVKDPFFSMQRRSLNTFMNALTGADFTCYPAATQTPKDFYNLLDVYIDALFFPILDKYSFMQEGHRLEFSIPEDSTSPLEYKGIVYNEMKGAMSSPGTVLNEILNAALFPDITYGINSGGDPKEIPSLSYAELCAFHKEFYHPSRCLFFFYGNMPLEGHLDFINDHILHDIKPVPPVPKIPRQERFTTPRQIKAFYPITDTEETVSLSLIAFGWLTCSILEQKELLALNILEMILMDTDASPLKMALLKSGLCTQASSYIDSEISEAPFVITLRGCKGENIELLESLIRNTLSKVANEGIPLVAVENAIHQFEFHRSEITGDVAPFGLSLFMRSALIKQHGGNPESGLKIHSLFDEVLKNAIENPAYFGDLINKYLLNNTHFVSVLLEPSKELAAKDLLEEQEILGRIKEKLSAQESQLIVDEAKKLADFQKRQEDEANIDLLPKLTLADVPKAPRDFFLQEENFDNLTVLSHHCFTNEIVYVDLISNLPGLKEEDLSIARLFTSLIGQMGCHKKSYIETLEFVQANTGGFAASLAFNLQASDCTQFSPTLYIKGKALYRKTDKLFELLKETIEGLDFSDTQRLKEIVLKQYTALRSGVNQSALKYALNLSASGLDIPSKISYHWYGLGYYKEIEKLAKDFDAQAKTLQNKLKQLKELMLGVGPLKLVITCDAGMYDKIKRHKFYGLQQLETKPLNPWTGNYIIEPLFSQGKIISAPVAFIGEVIKTISYTHEDSAVLSIAAFLLENIYLHATLREQGGAYGGGASSSPMSGSFYFYSYRDPNIASSLTAFNKAVKDLLSEGIEAQDLEEAKLEMIQTLDMPVSPGSRGDLAYGWLAEGKTINLRQNFRNRVLTTTEIDVIEVIKKYIQPKLPSAIIAVFASKELFDKEKSKLVTKGLGESFNTFLITPV